ncbi:BCCT family transporter [Haloferula sargassicola]|uniref:Glycine betaine/proline betaine transporter BetS n=1 Tax=Haloferula sargassicola TaxID=490096 RepID=A0ABP9UJX0_9BACT
MSEKPTHLPEEARDDAHSPDYIKIGPLEFHPIVFPVSALLIILFTIGGGIWALHDAAGAEAAFNAAKTWMSDSFGWFFVLSVNALLLVAILLASTRLGDVRLGGRLAKPDFSYPSWFAMLFSAGMGIGLVFWSVAEPIYHYQSPPNISLVAAPAGERIAMSLTFFHWGLHAWGVYTVVAAAIAFFAYNRKLPLTIRSTFYPLLGERVRGPIGHAIDILAVVATLFGVATSLGFGVQQVNSGLHFLMPETVAAASGDGAATSLGLSGTTVQIILITLITLIATGSVVSGLDKGIKFLSNTNMFIAGALLLMVLILGPTAHLLDAFVQNLGSYLARFLSMAFWTEAYQADSNGNPEHWQNGWTIFYWAWWIAWSPFVGMFIARISYGRTIREFALGVLLVPTLVTFFWLTVFGNTALYEEVIGGGGIVAAVGEDVSTALFVLLERFPWAGVTGTIAIFVIVTFFVTSSDSGSLVIDTITGGGHPNPPVIQKIFWALLEGAVAAVLLLCGGLSALQTASIITGFPFAIVLLLMAWSLLKGLKQAQLEQRHEEELDEIREVAAEERSRQAPNP